MSHQRPATHPVDVDHDQAAALVGQPLHHKGEEVGRVEQAEHHDDGPVLTYTVGVPLDQIGGIEVKDGKVVTTPPPGLPA